MFASRVFQGSQCLRGRSFQMGSNPRSFILGQSQLGRRELFNTRRSLQQSGSPLTLDSISEHSAMLYLDNVFPLKMNILDIRQYFFRETRQFLETRTQKMVPVGELPHGFAIQDVVARIKDGGAIVRFSYNSTEKDKATAAKEIVSAISQHLETRQTVAPFNLQPVRAFLVKGEPFLEDILARYPSPRLRIEFVGEPAGVQELYKHLRPYGRIYDIAIYPNPHVSKDPPRYAIVQFTRVRSATSARNCLHGYKIHNTKLNTLYEQQLHTNVIKDWVVEHPKITVPVFAALAAGLTYSVFDPMRIFCITSKVTQRFNPEEYALYRWLRRETWARLVHFDRNHSSGENIWGEDIENQEKIRSWLRETPASFVVVTGPKGSGKSSLVKAAVTQRRNDIFIDCEQLASTNNESEMIGALAEQFGYFPVFTWVSSLTSLIETVIVATTGQQAGLSASPEAQIRDILETVAVAIRDIVPHEDKDGEDDDHKSTIADFFRNWLGLGPKSRKQKDGSDIEEDECNCIPVVVIDNFMCRESPKNEVLWDQLAAFGALLVENEIAHVVFVSANVGVNKVLSKALPGKTFESIMLSDAPPEIASAFISKQLGDKVINDDLPPVVDALGGRLTELELLVQKIKMNMNVKDAFEDIVQRNVVEIRKYGLNESVDKDERKLDWSTVQFWEIVKGLAQSKSINFDELKWSPFFNGDETPLLAMERSELITIHLKDGRPNAIRPGKPVFYAAFNRLVSDTTFAASMEIESKQFLKKDAETRIAKLEDKVVTLSSINNGKLPREIDARVRFLLGKIASTQKEIEFYESDIKRNKQLVSESWIDM